MATDRGLAVDVAYLDFSKAFDTVPHKRLLQKLSMFGVQGHLLEWFSDYLRDRYMVVSIGGKCSVPRCVSSGVIQGSVLGPLLFQLYINDVDDHVVSAQIVKYADDIKCSISLPKDHLQRCEASRLFQCDLNNIHSWSLANGLTLNPSKCAITHFGSSNPRFSYSVNDVLLPEVSCFKDLGVMITDSYTFKPHVSNITLRANRLLGVIKKAFVSRDVKVLLTLYKSHVRSILEFCNIAWCPHLISS